MQSTHQALSAILVLTASLRACLPSHWQNQTAIPHAGEASLAVQILKAAVPFSARPETQRLGRKGRVAIQFGRKILSDLGVEAIPLLPEAGCPIVTTNLLYYEIRVIPVTAIPHGRNTALAPSALLSLVIRNSLGSLDTGLVIILKWQDFGTRLRAAPDQKTRQQQCPAGKSDQILRDEEIPEVSILTLHHI